jgi:hypothetical protein
MTTITMSESAQQWGTLWGDRPRAWADLRLGDLQCLPYADDAFDVVTGFASFLLAELATGGAAAGAGVERELELGAAILCGLAHCRRPGRGSRVTNEWHVVIARA